MFQQRVGQLLERSQSLPLQLIHPFLQVVEHSAFVAIVPEPVQALFEQVSLEGAPVQLKQGDSILRVARQSVLPSANQQSLLPFDQAPAFFPGGNSGRRTSSIVSLACWRMWNLSYTILHCGAHSSMLFRNGAHMSTQAASIRFRCPATQLAAKEFIQCLLLALPAKPQRLRCLQIAHYREKLA